MNSRLHMPRSIRVIIAGGGTGGHVFPAIAIAKAIKNKPLNTRILFVGAKGRLEMSKVPEAGFHIIGLNVAGLQRRFTWKNLLVPFKLIDSMIRAKNIIKRFKPDVVIGVGGYASGPVMRSAAKQGIPTLIQEQNSYPGLTNRLLAKKAEKICVAYEGWTSISKNQKYSSQEILYVKTS
jgi:UDP-N-acetylglucosamine--N-acetylmuramyl-(pentapeptide) pyrophosphoryl-undecaprenol N-acetylglucosamine transferase